MSMGIPDIKIVFRLDGRKLTLTYRQVPFRAWQELKKALGFTPTKLVEGLQDNDVEAVGAVIWLERKQRERKLTWGQAYLDIDQANPEFEVVDLVVNGHSMIPPDDDDDETEDDDEDPIGAGS